jgi:hypothetical protein
MRPHVPFKWNRNHHLYYGIAFIIFGSYNYLLMLSSNELMALQPLWLSCIGIGIFMAIDDIIEHCITRDAPIRLIFELLQKIFPGLRK